MFHVKHYYFFNLGRVQMKKPPSPIERLKSYEKINVSRETLGG